MKYLLEYKKFNEIDLLTSDSIKSLDKETIMSLLYKYRNKEIGDKLWKIIDKFKDNKDWGYYNTPDSWFEEKEYKTFMQYFKRRISDKKWQEIKSQNNNKMSMPCEANVESIGDFSDTSSILRLKKSTDAVKQDLFNIGIKEIDNLSFLNFKLLKVYYHRVHSPVSGKIVDIMEVSPDDNFFGENNLWILEIETLDLEKVYIVLVGELAIQDFTFRVEKGDSIDMFEEIGNFNWASQVIIIYDKQKFPDLEIKSGNKYFVGDKIF